MIHTPKKQNGKKKLPASQYCEKFNKLCGPWKGSINISYDNHWASLVTQLVKNPLIMQETPVQFLGQEDLREKE